FTNGHSGLNHSSTTYFPLYWESECVWPFASGNKKSGAAPPTGGGSKAKIAVATNDVRTVNVIFLFINGLENEVIKLVQFSCEFTTLARTGADTNTGTELFATVEWSTPANRTREIGTLTNLPSTCEVPRSARNGQLQRPVGQRSHSVHQHETDLAQYWLVPRGMFLSLF